MVNVPASVHPVGCADSNGYKGRLGARSCTGFGIAYQPLRRQRAMEIAAQAQLEGVGACASLDFAQRSSG
jgi:hypothetical protein